MADDLKSKKDQQKKKPPGKKDLVADQPSRDEPPAVKSRLEPVPGTSKDNNPYRINLDDLELDDDDFELEKTDTGYPDELIVLSD